MIGVGIKERVKRIGGCRIGMRSRMLFALLIFLVTYNLRL